MGTYAAKDRFDLSSPLPAGLTPGAKQLFIYSYSRILLTCWATKRWHGGAGSYRSHGKSLQFQEVSLVGDAEAHLYSRRVSPIHIVGSFARPMKRIYAVKAICLGAHPYPNTSKPILVLTAWGGITVNLSNVLARPVGPLGAP